MHVETNKVKKVEKKQEVFHQLVDYKIALSMVI